jgi:hypothetical protein
VSGTETISYGYGDVKSIYTVFGNSQGDAQGATGDSGGGMFFNNGGTWELAGLLVAIDIYSNQPPAAVYGNITYAVDIAQYRSQILNAIPEPAPFALMLGGLGLLVWIQRMRR